MGLITKLLSLINGHAETVDLSANTLGVQNIQVNGVLLSQTDAHASFSGTIPGTATSVTITAVNSGSIGNSIALVFSGSNTITAEIAAWNIANPSNQALLSSGNGSQTPSPQTLNLSGGQDAGSSLIGNPTSYNNFTPTSATIKGAFEGVDAALSAVSGASKVDKFTLTGTDATNKFVTLTSTPSNPGAVILLVEDAGNMFYGVDFTVSGNHLSWSGLELDGILSSGDNLTVTYHT